jgi:hypothetical protein
VDHFGGHGRYLKIFCVGDNSMWKEDIMEQNDLMVTMTLFWGVVYGVTILASICRAMVIPLWVSNFSKDIKRD